MMIKVSGRHMEITEPLRDFAEKKVSRISKYNRVSEIEVIFCNEGKTYTVEIIVKADNRQRFVVKDAGEDAYSCLDTAIDKIERQLKKDKEKSHNHKGRIGAAEASTGAFEVQSSGEEIPE